MRTDLVQHGIVWFAFGGLVLVGLSLIWGRGSDANGAAGDKGTTP